MNAYRRYPITILNILLSDVKAKWFLIIFVKNTNLVLIQVKYT